MNRSLPFLAVALPLYALGCAAPVDEDVASTESAIKSTDPGPSAIEYEITSYSYVTGTITGVNKHGRTVTATIASSTTFRPAALDRFIPGDPCRTPAVAYNEETAGGETPVGPLGEMAALGCNARIWVRASTVRALQPMP